MKKLLLIAEGLINACGGSVLKSILVIFIFYFSINQLMATVEILVFGERFGHWGDIVLQIIFIAFALEVVYIAGIIKAIEFEIEEIKAKNGDE
tara:strand:+ start:285 stop:563 length:279 start_codon:yes stop_codon:yes gene_type:complete